MSTYARLQRLSFLPVPSPSVPLPKGRGRTRRSIRRLTWNCNESRRGSTISNHGCSPWEVCGAHKKNTLGPSPQGAREDGEIVARIIANPEGVQLCITMGASHGGAAEQVEKPHPRSLFKGEGGLGDL